MVKAFPFQVPKEYDGLPQLLVRRAHVLVTCWMHATSAARGTQPATLARS